ncbi:MAG: hypothetical protein KR126chlam1_01122 [Chlamydiae bacterium]|nr:hypothetical protein [Chlamydiota bacterium]
MMMRVLLPLFLFFSVGGWAFSLRPVPWITDEAVAFLEMFCEENPEAKILEFGSGASTLWFAKRTPNLYSVEHDERFYALVQKELSTNPDCFPAKHYLRKRPYYSIADEFSDGYFDLIVVDGRNRKGCMARSIRILKPGGILMLDNAERRYYHPVFPLLEGWDCTVTQQRGPDQCGFCYPGWETTWWIKPGA